MISLDCWSSGDLRSLSSELLRSLCCRGFSSSALICFNQLSWMWVHSSSFWIVKAIKEGTTYLLQSWHTAGFGNQARTNGHTSPSTGTKHSWQMNQPVSVCQRANHHHLPMHDIIDLVFFKLYTFLSMSKFIRTKSSLITVVPQKPPTLNSAQIKSHARIQKLYVLCFSG